MQTFSYFYRKSLHMVKYISQKQLKLSFNDALCHMNLNKDNRWIQLGNSLLVNFLLSACERLITILMRHLNIFSQKKLIIAYANFKYILAQ